MSLADQLNRQYNQPERPKTPLPRKNQSGGRAPARAPVRQLRKQYRAPEQKKKLVPRQPAKPLLTPSQQAFQRAAYASYLTGHLGKTTGGGNVFSSLLSAPAKAVQKSFQGAAQTGESVAQGKLPRITYQVGPLKGDVGKQISAEVQGKGLLGKLPGLGAKVVEKGTTAPVVPGVGPKNIGGIHVPGAAAATIQPQKVKGTIGGNVVQDAFDFPAQSVQSVYAIGKAAVHAAQGNTSDAEKLWQGYTKTGVIPALVQGNFEEAAKRANKHPLFAAAEIRGLGGAIGRTAGAVTRATPGLKAVGATRREPLQLFGNQTQPRSYSKDLIVKAGQKAVENFQRSRGIDPNVARGRGQVRQLKKRADFQAETDEQLRRQARAQELQAATKPITPTRVQRVRGRITKTAPAPGVVPSAHGDSVVQAIVERRIRTPESFAPDLQREVTRLNKAHAKLTAKKTSANVAAARANRMQVKGLEDALKAHKAGTLNRHELFQSAGETVKATNRLEKGLIGQGVLDKEQALRAKVTPYAVTHMGAKYNRDTGRIELPTKTGSRQLPTEEIVAHMKANSVPLPGFVSHKMSNRGLKAFMVANRLNRAGIGVGKRTGAATAQGTHGADYQGIVEHRVKARGVLEQTKGFDRKVKEMMATAPRGRYFRTKEAADAEIRRQSQDDIGNQLPTPALRAVRTKPLSAKGERAQAITHAQEGAGELPDLKGLTEQQFAAATKDAGKGNYAVVPEVQFQRLQEHAKLGPRNTLERGIGSVTQQFRGTVLPFSPKWLTGNVVEAWGVRLPVKGAGPHTVPIGRMLVEELRKQDADIAAQFEGLNRRGLLYGSTERMKTYAGAERFKGTSLQGTANALATFRRLPVVKQVVDKLTAYQRVVFHFNGKIEQAAQDAATGKLAKDLYRELGDFGQSWARAQVAWGEVARMVAGEIVADPNLIYRFAENTRDVLGKYDAFSPSMRAAVQTYAPFLPWYLNSARFIYWTLPIHHPVLTGVLVATEEALNSDYHQSTLPGALKSAIKLPGGGLLDAARYTPAGAFTDIGSWGDVVLPQAGSTLKALQGQDFTGREVKVPTGGVGPKGGKQTRSLTDPEKLGLAGYTQAEGLLPGLRIARTVLEGGKTAEPTSTIFSPKTKPQSQNAGVLNRILNPARPVKLKPKKQLKGKKPRKGRVRRRSSGDSTFEAPSSGGSSSGGDVFEPAGRSSGGSSNDVFEP